jgi:hypothetical protein
MAFQRVYKLLYINPRTSRRNSCWGFTHPPHLHHFIYSVVQGDYNWLSLSPPDGLNHWRNTTKGNAKKCGKGLNARALHHPFVRDSFVSRYDIMYQFLLLGALLVKSRLPRPLQEWTGLDEVSWSGRWYHSLGIYRHPKRPTPLHRGLTKTAILSQRRLYLVTSILTAAATDVMTRLMAISSVSEARKLYINTQVPDYSSRVWSSSNKHVLYLRNHSCVNDLKCDILTAHILSHTSTKVTPPTDGIFHLPCLEVPSASQTFFTLEP